MFKKTSLSSVIFSCIFSLSTSIKADDTEVFYIPEFSEGQVLPNTILIMDTSTSMGNPTENGETRISITKRASKEVINRVNNVNLSMMRFNRAKKKNDEKQSEIYTYDIYDVVSHRYKTITVDKLDDCIKDIQQTSLHTDKEISANAYCKAYALDYIYDPRTDREKKYNLNRHKIIKGGSHLGAYLLKGLTKIAEDSESNKQNFKKSIDHLEANGNTPLTESLYEAYLYLTGQDPYFGQEGLPTPTDPNDLNNGKYKSPITHECQLYNNVTVFTDGEPTDDSDANEFVRELIARSPKKDELPEGLSEDCGTGFDQNRVDHGNAEGGCIDELAWYMANHDLNPNLIGNQVARISVISGFDLPAEHKELMDNVSKHGGTGSSITSNNYDELVTALEETFTNTVTEGINSVTAPVAPVSSFQQFGVGEYTYLTMFEPKGGVRWPGNLKKFKVNADNELIGIGGVKVLNDEGEMTENARDFWAGANQNVKKVSEGGIREKLPNSANRSIYAQIGENLLKPLKIDNLDEINNATHIGLTESEINFVRSKEGITDPLHTKPVSVVYSTNEENETTESTIFFTTNMGGLHAINADTGVERYTFFPKNLLKNIKQYYANKTNHALEGNLKKVGEKLYGLDGPISLWIYDNDKDNQIESVDGDHVYLYLTMRRGGHNIYALDVTNFREPSLKWQIKGGITSPSENEYRELAHTWSKPMLGRVKIGNEIHTVLFFTGGYNGKVANGNPNSYGQDPLPNIDARINNQNIIPEDNIGRAIYMVDAETGELLWWASANNANDGGANNKYQDMKYSFPASVAPIDINSDGFTDYIYAIDIAGQLWRFDFNKTNNNADNLASGGIIAKLGGDGRRFYNRVDAAILDKSQSYVAITVGSGYRAHPNSEDEEDKFFMIKDPYVFSPPARANNGSEIDSYKYASRNGGNKKVIGIEDLYNASNNLIVKGSETEKSQARLNFNTKHGWFIDLSDNEKALSPSITFGNMVLFTTFTHSNKVDLCSPTPGTAKGYVLNLYDATGGINDGTADDDNNRYKILKYKGIADTPVVITRNRKTTANVGFEKLVDLSSAKRLYKTWWRREPN
ncbi:hypothetical protein H0A36_01225 [Endozoicomonas sp. SM1973]|uniref:PilC beta-propeller domain-containing protein n=1 Tax=Spartinivicinus marinus TaxID=2994442 RepID=A0A853HW22_9GAMM|nr:PilC/PilY family type IV pilus protein [Spartinivicinus marinus]MCX4026775.1 PilC/PilY family type IV pilus protein [Spartinivicinus marinus]NYZ64609.1 hypothetical protein [Spartinivicinus marinus]